MMKITSLFLILGVFLTACSAASTRPAAPPETKNSGPDVEPPSPTLADLLKQNDVSAMDRIGSIYYVLGRYGEALTVWTRALPLEHDVQKRRELENSILVTRRGLGLADGTLVAAAPPAPAASAPPAPENNLSEETKTLIQALYKTGVKYYTSGQYLQATTVFLHILEMDPGNADATKALKRLKLGQ